MEHRGSYCLQTLLPSLPPPALPLPIFPLSPFPILQGFPWPYKLYISAFYVRTYLPGVAHEKEKVT